MRERVVDTNHSSSAIGDAVTGVMAGITLFVKIQ